MSDFSGFEPFLRNRRPCLASDEVSLTEKIILLSQDIVLRHFAGVPRVQVLFNPRTSQIGLRPSEESAPATYKLSCRCVTIGSLRKHYALENRGRFRARFDDEAGLLIIDLNTPYQGPTR